MTARVFTEVNLDGFEGVDADLARAHMCRDYFEHFDHVWVKSNWQYVCVCVCV